jgi:hypothetical protein
MELGSGHRILPRNLSRKILEGVSGYTTDLAENFEVWNVSARVRIVLQLGRAGRLVSHATCVSVRKALR